MFSSAHVLDTAKMLLRYRDQEFLCDTEILSRDRVIKAHSAVLAAVSPVFSSAFAASSNASGVFQVDLQYVDPLVLQMALDFIYTGQVSTSSSNHASDNELAIVYSLLRDFGINMNKANSSEMKLKRKMLRICSVDRMRHLVFAQSRNELIKKVQTLFSWSNALRFVLEDDGSLIGDDAIEMILTSDETIGSIMALRDGEIWRPASAKLRLTGQPVFLEYDGPEIECDKELSECDGSVLALLEAEEIWRPAVEQVVTPISSRRGSHPATDVTTDSTTHSTSSSTVSTDSSPSHGGKQWPRNYEIPHMPAIVTSEMLKAKSVSSLSCTTYRAIIRCLYEDMLQYTLYPKTTQFNAVCSALIRRFPALQDRVVCNYSSNKDRYKTWLSSLRTKFKKERLKLPFEQSEEIRAKRIKHSRKRIYNSNNTDAVEIKRCCRVQVPHGSGEDGPSIQHHIIAMKTELSKSVKDYNLINDRMKRTIVDRRTMIQTSCIKDVLDQYPCLACDVQLIAEVERLKKINILSKLSTFFNVQRCDLILKAIKMKKGAGELIECIGKSSNIDIDSQRQQCAFLLIPVLFGESIDDWFVFNKKPTRSTPTLVAHGNSLDNLFHEGVLFETMADGTIVTHPKNIIEGLSSVIALHWVFDIAYCNKMKKTLTFLASFVCKLEEYNITATVQRRLNLLYSI